jgi:hypothetical protein
VAGGDGLRRESVDGRHADQHGESEPRVAPLGIGPVGGWRAAATSKASPATLLQRPTCLSMESVSTPLAISRAPNPRTSGSLPSMPSMCVKRRGATNSASRCWDRDRTSPGSRAPWSFQPTV